jgi:cobalt-zinc-cadmium resistance protein CzcA
MIDRFIATCCQRRGIVWLVCCSSPVRRLQLEAAALEAYPDIADVTSQIVTQVPGLGAEEIEQQITIPLERALLARPACTCCARAACSACR